jgi:hypothetical protein
LKKIKLTLKKTTIARIGNDELKNINGGYSWLATCITDNEATCGDTCDSCPFTRTGGCLGDTCHICQLNNGG